MKVKNSIDRSVLKLISQLFFKRVYRMFCEDKVSDLTMWAEDLIFDLKIPYTVSGLVNDFKKIYYYIDIDKHILRIHGNKYIIDENDPKNSKQTKVQIYNLKGTDQYNMKFHVFQEKYQNVIELCIAIEQLKLFKSLEKEEAKKSKIGTILTDVKLRSFLKRKK